MRKLTLVLALFALFAGTAFAAEELVVHTESSGSDVYWHIEGFDFGHGQLTVTGPKKIDFAMELKRGENPRFRAVDDEGKSVDGLFRWNLMVRSYLGEELLTAIAKDRLLGTDKTSCELQETGKLKAHRVSGTFYQVDGKVHLPKEVDENEERLASGEALPNKDFVINDDLIVDGSACIGFDCVNGESFSFDTIRLKENNLRIKFDDTSVAASFPRTDWQLTANDSANGGASKFSIDDISGSRTPFTVEANARSHSLYVDDGGRIGNRTSTPSTEIHTIDGDTPTLRLQQDGSSGFAPQTWDVAGNETNFFIRDVSNGSTLPFRIRPSAPTDSLAIDEAGEVGVGTVSPRVDFHVLGSGTAFEPSNASTVGLFQNSSATNTGSIVAVVSGTDGNAQFHMGDTDDAGKGRFLYRNNVDAMSLFTDGSEQVRIDSDGNVCIGCTTADHNLEVVDGAACSEIDAGETAFTVCSSRTLKQNISPIQVPGLLDKMASVDVFAYDYIDGPGDRIGLMAEDFHGIFGRGDNDKVNGYEVQMALWMAVQQLTAQNRDLLEQNREHAAGLAELKARLEALQAE